MEENQKGRHYHPTTTTTGKEKEASTQISCATTVENLDIQATSVGGNRKDNYTTSTSLNQFGPYRMTTQHNHYSHLLNQQRRRS
eukprot:324515-Amphidinium_carterae.1